MNAEPTYGVCWAYFRIHPFESTRQCFRNAKKLLRKMVIDEDKSLDISVHLANISVHDMDPELKFKAIFS